ncbi:MAG TPA: hypothetical protein PKH77_02440 [Anaerolineae bacterium]|nr:hypothetical protein [Anaerolineae bacterium]
MQTLVIIPSLMHKYSFSAPLAWMFSDHVAQVRGIYSIDLNKAVVKAYDSFIVELGWFIELVEFDLIVRFIRKHNKKATILFGGLYAQLKYREIFANSPVDYFIKGDNEVPIKHYLDGVDPRAIPNMVGRDFENERRYVFQQEDYKSLEFNLDWFPDYFKYLAGAALPDDEMDLRFDEMPLFPRYLEKPGENLAPERRWRVPPRGGYHYLPMLLTARGECPIAHAGCEYCLGSRKELLCSIYGRRTLIMDNETLIYHLHKIEKKFSRASIVIGNKFDYDFRGHFFDLEVTIEADYFNRPEDIAKILPAFRQAKVHTTLYEDTLTCKKVRDAAEIAAFQALEDENHQVYFLAFGNDAEASAIPKQRQLHAEVILPHWTNYDFYDDRANALRKSREWYFLTGQTNLYPLPRRISTRLIRSIAFRVAYLLNKAKLIDLSKKVL